MDQVKVTERVQKQLFELQDVQYRDFQAKLLPTIDKETIIGVRMPVLRKFAKGYGKTKVTIQSQDPGHKSTEFYVIVKRPLWHYLVVAGIGVLLMVGMVELMKKERKKK